ncbi:MAG: STAS/SEC14 domain-containing protein [Candidatus Omnitrophota bacterium]
MSNRIRWIDYKGKKILVHDYSELKGFNRGGEQVLNEVSNFIDKLTENNILELIDVRNSYGDLDSIKKMKEMSKKMQPHVKKCAIIGVTGVKKVLLDTINVFSQRQIKPFATEEEAKEWLVAED